MKPDDIMAQMERLIGLEKAKAYKAGFTDGLAFVSEPKDNIYKAMDKAVNHVLEEVAWLYGQGKEYKVVKECLDAVIYDLKATAHLEKPTRPMSDYWDDEYGDDL